MSEDTEKLRDGEASDAPSCSVSSDFLPPDILEKAQEISDWMQCQGYRNWELMGICDRNFADRMRKMKRERDEARTYANGFRHTIETYAPNAPIPLYVPWDSQPNAKEQPRTPRL